MSTMVKTIKPLQLSSFFTTSSIGEVKDKIIQYYNEDAKLLNENDEICICYSTFNDCIKAHEHRINRIEFYWSGKF